MKSAHEPPSRPAAAPMDGAPELCRLGAAALREGYRTSAFSPVEVARAALDRAEAVDPAFKAFTRIDRDGALAAAARSEARWRADAPLSAVDGVPTTLKDIVWVEGAPVRYGSSTTSPEPQAVDAPAVALMRRAGLVFLGQTTTPEFGWKAVTDSSTYGVTRNPHDPSRTPGGSSGGAAVAAATGAGVFHLGTDGGGSIRIPAAFTGIVGLKPTFGRVPAYPASAFGTLAHLGPMTRSVADAAAMLAAMSGRDLSDWNQGAGRLDPLGAPAVDLSTLTVGHWRKPPLGGVDPAVEAAVDAVLRLLERAGSRIEPVDLPGEDLHEVFRRHWSSGAAARLALVPAERRDAIDPGFLEIAGQGAALSAPELVAAQVRRAEFGAAMDRLLERHDVVVSPATACLPFEAGLEVPAESGLTRWTEWASFSFPINLSQQPALVLPCGFVAGGLPIALQVVGARGADARVLAIGSAIEALLAEAGFRP
jgi:aspartyl-tRNA(Asn)/glutamyl-tRNA(Gln) amidotransferase subunit A